MQLSDSIALNKSSTQRYPARSTRSLSYPNVIDFTIAGRQNRASGAWMAFFVGCFFSTFIGRKIGWRLSRSFLYTSSWTVCVILCLGWAIGVAYALRLFILAMQPGLVLKVFGYGAGAYISVPNYGLSNENGVVSPNRRKFRRPETVK
jgi:hypothetical protein